VSVASEISRTIALRSSRNALRAERVRVAHWRRLVRASLDLAIAAAAVPEALGDDARLLVDGLRAQAPRRSTLVRAMRWGLPTGEVHRLPELRALDTELAQYARFLDDALATTTDALIELLTTDPATALAGLPHTANSW